MLGEGQLRPTANRPASTSECGAIVRLVAGAFHCVVHDVDRIGCRGSGGVRAEVDGVLAETRKARTTGGGVAPGATARTRSRPQVGDPSLRVRGD